MTFIVLFQGHSGVNQNSDFTNCTKQKVIASLKKKFLPSQIQTLHGVSTNIGWITQKAFADSEFTYI